MIIWRLIVAYVVSAKGGAYFLYGPFGYPSSYQAGTYFEGAYPMVRAKVGSPL